MGKMRKIALSLFVSVLYGLLTLGFVFVLMPRWLLPELIWNILLVGVPAAAVIPLIRAKWYVSPACIFAGIPIHLRRCDLAHLFHVGTISCALYRQKD